MTKGLESLRGLISDTPRASLNVTSSSSGNGIMTASCPGGGGGGGGIGGRGGAGSNAAAKSAGMEKKMKAWEDHLFEEELKSQRRWAEVKGKEKEVAEKAREVEIKSKALAALENALEAKSNMLLDKEVHYSLLSEFTNQYNI